MYFAEIEAIETARLKLRKLEANDASIYFERIGSRATVTEHMLWEPHKTLAESVASVEKAMLRYAQGGCYRWAITEIGVDSVIGIIELLRFDETSGICSFAYMLCDDYWGKGYGTEALRAAMDFAFKKLGIQKIQADHFATNPASGAVMRKVGMRYIGTIPAKYEKHGVKVDAVCYEITRAEFR